MKHHIELLKAIIRLVSVQTFFGSVALLTSAPEYLVMMSHRAHLPFSADTATIGLADLAMRFVLHIVFGISLWFGAGAFAKLIGKGLFTEENNLAGNLNS
jgi:hypothetical protein